MSDVSFADRMKAAKAAKAAGKVAPTTKAEKKSKSKKAKAKPALPPRKLFAAKKASAKPIKGVDAPAPKKVIVVRKADSHDKVKSEATRGAGHERLAGKVQAAQVQDTPALPGGPPLMERSYKREFKGIGATQRGNVLQITVTFKPDQFDVLKERADLYQCSLSEAVRKCVMAGPLPSSD